MKISILFSVLFAAITSYAAEIIPLNSNWQFKNVKSEQWNPATVPGVVHMDLLKNGDIKDPFYANNEMKQQWIEFEDWAYSTTIQTDSNLLKKQHIELVFEGLDTYATVYINGKEVLFADNMFRQWEIDAKPFLNVGDNELLIIFHSPLNLNRSNVENGPYELPAANETVDLKVSPYTRKAAYHFGWDWGPRFVTCGIWRPAYLRAWNTLRIEDIHYTTEKLTETKARVDFSFEVNSDLEKTYQFVVGNKAAKVVFEKGKITIKQSIEINNFKEWNPIGYGEQHFQKIGYGIYDNTIRLAGGDIDVAIRDIELVHTPDSIGTSFYFKVNGRPFYAKGANYIPQDMFLTRVQPEQYERLIQQALDANINMIRVWGGGIYENDIFYDLCDKYGILVWQDFMFANSMYPKDAAFMNNIQQEVRDNIKRLRNHPSIALWCGNNEIEVAWGNWGWQKQYGYSSKDSAEIWNTYLSIFHEMIPQTLEKMDPTRPYVPTTPLSNWGKPENFNHASMHYWGVWHGREPIENFAKNVGRFVAEYGYQSFPNYETLLKVMTEEDMNLDSDVMKNRQKSYIGNGIIVQNVKKYVSNSPTPESIGFKEWTRLTQLVQAHAYGYAIRQHRVQTPHCMGTLFWQLNDCWPGPSWSVIDYYGNEKSAYNEVKKYYKPVVASINLDQTQLSIDLVSDVLDSIPVNVTIKAYSQSDNVVFEANAETTLQTLRPQQLSFTLPKKLNKKFCKKKNVAYYAIEVTSGVKTLLEDYYYPKNNATVKFP